MPGTNNSEKNRIYDTAAGALWHLAVYEPVHGGREFTNMAGAALLDFIGSRFRLGQDDHVLELCSGTGEVCRYLAARSRCTVTGIELNSAQLRHARLKHHRLPPDVRGRIRYVQADVTTWQPDRAYDLVIAIDSLALLPEPGHALAIAHAALAPGGSLAFADILGGPTLTERVRTRTWDYDGIRPLPAPPETAAMLTGLGFTDVAYTDISDAAVDCFRAISGALTLNRRAIESVCDHGEYAHWRESTEFYVDSFASGQLTYWRYTAEKPDSEGEIR
ncbi:class I SAM-dependent methyltransferase [Actinokineospora sp.]|uniref:class I SAM-dependent methyltransferase n=1 Tax=Actinokineospora sp. TaxID=1872133 RepID=UPI0040384A13